MIPRNLSSSSKPGFTLIEVLVVVAIIAVLAVLALTMGPKMQSKAKMSKSVSNMCQIAIMMRGYGRECHEQNGRKRRVVCPIALSHTAFDDLGTRSHSTFDASLGLAQQPVFIWKFIE